MYQQDLMKEFDLLVSSRVDAYLEYSNKKITQLEAKLKAADEVIKYASHYDNGEDQNLKQALEHYKSL